jgi:3-methyladenine DNA glycosylase/8-oxoguanine DNA glycosylase
VAERVDAQAWGDGGDWLLRRVPALTGQLDRPQQITTGHPAVLRAQHRHPQLRLGASGTLYHELLPVIIGQRITAGEAVAQWSRLVRELGSPAPGPNTALRLPPTPARIVGRPAWWFHRLGIEAKRAEALREVARHAGHVHAWGTLDADTCGAKLALLRGIGIWTIGSTLGPALGDPDAFAIGDYHLKNTISWALAGRPRGTDDEMVELLAPYAGQRGRVVRLLQLDGHAAPKFGPRQRILPMRRW